MENSGEKILELVDIQTYYGRSHILQGLSMEVRNHEAVSILGRNGVGKTTTLRTIIGLIHPLSGRVIINGKDVTRWPPHKIAREGVAYVPAERYISPDLTVQENLRLGERGGPGRAWTIDKIYDWFPILKERKCQEGSTLSGGEQQMLAIARALMGNPLILLLDEPTQGLAPIIVKEIVHILSLCSQNGITILIVEQNYRMALQVASRHYLMNIHGIIADEVVADELRADDGVVRRHLSI